VLITAYYTCTLNGKIYFFAPRIVCSSDYGQLDLFVQTMAWGITGYAILFDSSGAEMPLLNMTDIVLHVG